MTKWNIDLEWIEDAFLGIATRNNTYYKFHGREEDSKIGIYVLCKKRARDTEPSMNDKNLLVGMAVDPDDVEEMIQKFLGINDERLVALENFGGRINYDQIGVTELFNEEK